MLSGTGWDCDKGELTKEIAHSRAPSGRWGIEKSAVKPASDLTSIIQLLSRDLTSTFFSVTI